MRQKNYLMELYQKLMEVFPEHITIEQAAEMAGVSKTKLKTDFHKTFGMSFFSYFRTERMKLAAKLLLETDRKIIDISGIVGYDNCSKFAKAFRDVMGCSPTAYRKCGNNPNFSNKELALTNYNLERNYK